jgi:hypothetical protein
MEFSKALACAKEREVRKIKLAKRAGLSIDWFKFAL